LVGRTLSHYKILEEISRGGMGIVYKALDLKLNRHIALKVLPPALVSDPERKRRFIQEAQAAAALDHPHLAMVHEIDEAEGVTFIAMELIEGEKLRDFMARERVSKARSLELALEICEGLALAHERGIVHRDIKPANIMVTREGHAKIIDFGLAKLVEPRASDASDIETALRHETEAGVVMGTVSYMSPEQARGEKVDHRSDVFSFGIVLYEMLAGSLPFQGPTGADTVSAILKEPAPPLPELGGEIPREAGAEIQSILDRCLAKARDGRPQSTAELVVALQTVLRLVASGAAMPAASRRLRRKLVIGGAVLAGVLALALGFFFSQRQKPSSTELPSGVSARRSVAVLGFKNLAERPESNWLSTALSEMFASKLSAGGKLRTIAGENVSRMKIELQLADADSFGRETLARIRANLGCDLVVLGSYLALGESGGGKIRLDVRLQDAALGETIATVTDAGGEGDLLDLISRTGARLREKLDVGELSTEERTGVRASLPEDPEAARLYVEGLRRLRQFDALGARDLLERALSLAPEHALAHSVLGKAWSELGYDEKARAEARSAFELSQALPREERLLVEARLREATTEWDRAAEVYRSLFEFFPDNVDYGLSLAAAQTSGGKGVDALATVASLRRLASASRVDPRIDLQEAATASALSDFERVRTAASAAAEKARAHSAPLLVARARLVEGWAQERLGQPEAAISAAEEAKSLFSQAGDRRGVAQAWNNLFSVLWRRGDLEGARRATTELLAIYREIGDRSGTATGLLDIGILHYERGDLSAALAAMHEALSVRREVQDQAGIATLVNNIGVMHHLQGATGPGGEDVRRSARHRSRHR
jgi:serine/threonine protein kinase/tetratricopeptide (TPR) repeat protein